MCKIQDRNERPPKEVSILPQEAPVYSYVESSRIKYSRLRKERPPSQVQQGDNIFYKALKGAEDKYTHDFEATEYDIRFLKKTSIRHRGILSYKVSLLQTIQ